MKVTYDDEFDILDMTVASSVDGSSLEDNTGVILHFGTVNGRDVVAATVMGASSWFRKSYDETSDTWFLGDTDESQSKLTVDGDFLGYWPLVDEYEDCPVPIGFALRNASKHLAAIRHHLKEPAKAASQPRI